MSPVEPEPLSQQRHSAEQLIDPPPALALANLQKSYGAVKAVNDLTLTVRQGLFFGFLGPERGREDHNYQDADRACSTGQRNDRSARDALAGAIARDSEEHRNRAGR